MKNNVKNLIWLAVLSLVLISPSFASAATAEELQAMINSLQAQIQSLQVQLSQIQGTTVIWCHTFNANLGVNSSNIAEITALQTALQKEGFQTNANNSFDETMASAITGFQQKYKDEILTPWGLQYGTGYIGKTTRAKLNQLYGCGVVPPVTKPYIKVLSPNGGEIYKIGDTIPVRWSVSGNVIGGLYMDLINSSGNVLSDDISGLGVGGPDLTQWQGVYSLNTTNYPAGQYKIYISTYGKAASNVSDTSDSFFTITSATSTQPSITVLSPNGGEQWQLGSTQTIRWLSNNYTGSVDIRLLEKDGQGGNYVALNIPNSGSYQWNISTNLLMGQYKVLIGSTGGGGDSSDAAFSIVAAGTLTPTTLPDLQVINISPTSVIAGQITTFIATVKNVGSVNITTPFAVNVNGTAVNVNSLAAGQTTTISASSGLSILGPNQFCVLVDIWNAVAESNESNNTFCQTVIVTTTTPVPTITVLSPNGGENWMLNSGINFIRWTPEPPNYPTIRAYLERYQNGQYVTIGEALPAAKGSIQWNGEIDRYGNYAPSASGYYIRVVNTQTGAFDRSDGAFMILPIDYMKVDLKVNASDGPITIPQGGQNVTISWTSTNADSCTFYGQSLGSTLTGLGTSGSQTVFLNANTNVYNLSVALLCSSAYGTRSDYVDVLPVSTTQPSITVLSPNGGEIYKIGDTIPVRWSVSGNVIGGLYMDLINSSGNVLSDDISGLGVGGPDLTQWQGVYSLNTTNYPAGQYKIYISTYGKAASNVSDTSDSFFTITSATSTQSSIDQLSQMANTLESAKAILEKMSESLRGL